jgi:catechol 2,3-dioxygenase-like lactoylglutathione lyase family enzyme
MLDHVSIQCADLTASAAFYDAVLATIGGERVLDLGSVIGFGIAPAADFWIGQQSNGDGFRESHVAFTAPDRDAVGGFFQAAVDAGAEVLHEPGCGRSITPTTTGPSCAIPTGTTSRPCATTRHNGHPDLGPNPDLGQTPTSDQTATSDQTVPSGPTTRPAIARLAR